MARGRNRFDSRFETRFKPRYESRFNVVLSDYTASIEEWRRAQRAPAEDLPELSSEQRDVARKLGISAEAYSRSLLAGQYGEKRMQGRAYALGELVQALLEKHGSRFRVAAVVADMFNGRWIVRVESSRGNLSLTIPRDLVDDVLDSGQASEVAKMKVIIRAGVSKAGDPSR
jgi:hypothetical protein